MSFQSPRRKCRYLLFSLQQTGALKELKALKAYPTFWWWRRGTDNPGAKPGKTDDGGDGSAPLESALSTNQLSKIRCASPKAEEATKYYVQGGVMLFRSTLLHLYRYSPPRFSVN